MSDLNVRYVAELARLQLTEEEIEKYQSQLGQILDHMEKLQEVDVSGIQATAHANPVYDVMREDAVEPDRRLSQEEALSNAPQRSHDQFRVTKIVE